MKNEAIEVLMNRRAIRKFKPEQVSDELLDAVLEAGVYAPSAMNNQKTVLVAVRDKETRDQLSRMNAAYSLGLGSCWIHRAQPMFDSPEGKALLKKWGLPETMKGVGNCILGYPDQEPAAKPRAEGRIVKV